MTSSFCRMHSELSHFSNQHQFITARMQYMYIYIYTIFVWGRHENMSPCTGGRVYSNMSELLDALENHGPRSLKGNSAIYWASKPLDHDPSVKTGLVWYYNMIVVFFPGFDRFIPGFDRFIPGFDRFIPAGIPVTGILPLKSKCTFINKICIASYFDIILFYSIWN